jgi:ATP-dependent helicase/nuclease subunit B
MLRLVFGRSGCGKTTFALKKAREAASNAGKVVLVVPEQFTYECERSIIRLIGPEYCLNTEVLSFSRMAHRVMRECGGFAERYLSDPGRYIIMSLALRQVSGLLGVYNKQVRSPAFIKSMVDTVSELKTYGVFPDLIDAALEKSSDGLLKQKMTDISLMMRAYEALPENGYADSLDDLTRLAQQLESCQYFSGKTVIVDSFKGFTPQEKSVLAQILGQAQDVYITLCAEEVDDSDEFGLFAPVCSTARQLIRLANKEGIKIASPLNLGEPRRFERDSLRFLEENVFRNSGVQSGETAAEIKVVSAANVYDEAKFAASEILTLVREKGCRFGDIVIITGSVELYRGILDSVFEKYGIPLFFDCRRDMEAHPLMALTVSALGLACGAFTHENIMRYLKTGLADLKTAEISLLENYMFTWDIRGEPGVRAEWRLNPSGFGEMTGDDKELLLTINEIKEHFLCLLYTSDAADDLLCVDLGGRRIIKKKRI